ncbi:hypothetical protein NOF04DRAFT_15945 [Fusarium oxysporum II5]|uniref:NAD-dependent epimerase/dehydratase domain-containing protein n=3 Tax=Fusarium oxysporum species complex TaxID=171631 RepID=X0J7Q1_FUSO5|nr:uncharacterized protein FOIG_14516 [Fusarium odoratissimum NRRL 54006]EXL92305.1 hypothetical protein FOIG_14516 [Fusarium odoratissimum NRRL 54006]KAK2133337.1 hypothetical protein NOF04DRAFT_15945 [Fusarium oxysporum II5]TXC08162.1 hypothetical protein FocTR4_00003527 [Fusarium oxysporum f. sp. cubense]
MTATSIPPPPSPETIKGRYTHTSKPRRAILVTGGAGFIGSHLVEALLAEGGWRVVVVDNFDEFYDPEIKRANLAPHLLNPNLKLYETDIEDLEALQTIFTDNGFSAIVHLAACAGVCAREFDVKQFLLGSSSSVYGLGAKAPFSENYKSTQPISPYATSKSAGELLCHTYSQLYDIRCICPRLITAYGPRQRPDLAIHKFTRLIHQGKPIPLFGDGSSRCDYTYVDDIIDGIFAALKYDGPDYYEVFNLGKSQTIQLMLSDQEPIKMNSEIRGISPVRVKDVPDDLKSVSSPLVEHGKTVDWSDMPLYTDFFLSTVPAMLHHNKYKERRATWWDTPWYHQKLRGLVQYALLPREADEPLATVQLEGSRVRYWAASAEEMDRYPRMGKLNANLTAYDRFPKMEPNETCWYGSRKPRESKATWEEEDFRDGGGEFNGY